MFALLSPESHGFSLNPSKPTSVLTRHHSNTDDDYTAIVARRDAMKTTMATLMGAVVIGSSSMAFVPSAMAAPLNLEEYKDGPRGLKYIVTKEAASADAPKPQRAQTVKASYSLYLNGFKEDNGRLIDTSSGIFGDKPLQFTAGVSKVIKGWDLAILDMKEGEARRLIVPSDLGYGDKGAGGAIPGGATLYFEVELVEVGKMAKIGPEQEKWLAEHPL